MLRLLLLNLHIIYGLFSTDRKKLEQRLQEDPVVEEEIEGLNLDCDDGVSTDSFVAI